MHVSYIALVLLLMSFMLNNSWADETHKQFTPCVAISEQERTVPIPPEIGKLLLDDDREWLGSAMIAARWRTTSPDPNHLYLAKVFDLNDDGGDEYLIKTNPAGPSAAGKNNPIWIVRRGKNGYEEMLQEFGSDGPFILPNITNGYHDICILQQGGAMDKSVTILRYNPTSSWYEAAECRRLFYNDDGSIETVAKCD